MLVGENILCNIINFLKLYVFTKLHITHKHFIYILKNTLWIDTTTSENCYVFRYWNIYQTELWIVNCVNELLLSVALVYNIKY